MHVGACGKRTDRDLCMTLDLVFKFDGEPSSKVVGKLDTTGFSKLIIFVVELKYDPDILKNAWYLCCNSLGKLNWFIG